MTEQIDIAVDLGAVPAPLPAILSLERLVEVATAPPHEIIEGVLHQGCKMILGGTSKSNNSWCLLDLAISVPRAPRSVPRGVAAVSLLVVKEMQQIEACCRALETTSSCLSGL